MNYSIALLASVLIAANVGQQPEQPIEPDFVMILEDAFKNQRSDFQIQGNGVVTRILSDDLDGIQHQRFILQISPTLTVLIAHNIDIAERLPNLSLNSNVEFYGEYEWNDLGGIIHWTHHDPQQKHIDGWLKYDGQTYQ